MIFYLSSDVLHDNTNTQKLTIKQKKNKCTNNNLDPIFFIFLYFIEVTIKPTQDRDVLQIDVLMDS